MKPHRGTFSNCRKVTVGKPTDEHLGFYLVGTFDPAERRFAGRHGHTSMVVKVDGAEIETLNSRYTVVNCVNSDMFKIKDNYEPLKVV